MTRIPGGERVGGKPDLREKRSLLAILVLWMAWPGALFGAGVPGVIGYQGRFATNGVSFNGTASFKFALVDAAGTNTYWSHNNSGTQGGEPSLPAVALAVTRGLFTVNLGDTSVSGMTRPIAASVFTNDPVFLRVWANDGVHGYQRLIPDQRIVAVGYALAAEAVTGPVSASQLTGTLPPAVGESALPSGLTVASSVARDPALLSKGYLPMLTLPPPDWVTSTASGAPSARYEAAVAWTGSRLLVWGGQGPSGALGTGGQLIFSDSLGAVPAEWSETRHCGGSLEPV
jgi:hypothetical protein